MPSVTGENVGLFTHDEQIEPYKPSWSQTIDAAFNLENSITSAVNSVTMYDQISNVVDPDYNPLDNMRVEDRDYIPRIAATKNAEQHRALENAIDLEKADRQTLAEAGLGMSLASTALAVVADPTAVFLPGGALVKSYKLSTRLGRTALNVGGAGGLSAVAQESALHASQVTRTAEESVINVAAATLLAAGFGTLLAGVAGRPLIRVTNKELHRAIDQVSNDFSVDSGGGGVGAARVRDLSQEDYAKISTEIDNLVAKGRLAPDEADKELVAAGAKELLARDGMKTNWAVDAALSGARLKLLTPELRTLNSPSSVVRGLMPELADTTVTLSRNVRDEATPLSAESMVKDWQGPKYRAMKNQDNEYTKYVTGKAKQFGDVLRLETQRIVGGPLAHGKLSTDDFNRAIGRAMMRADDVTGVEDIPDDAVPFVNAAAAYWRKEVIDPLTKIAVDQGRLEEGVTPKTAASYFMRVYDNDLLNNSKDARENFLNVTTDWLTRRQGEAVSRSQGFPEEAKTARESISAARQQIRAVETAVKKGTLSATKVETKAVTDAALEALEARLVVTPKIPSGADIDAKAQKAGIAAFFRTFKKELAEETHDAVSVSVERAASKDLDDLLATAADDTADTALLPLIRDELTQVGEDIASDSAAAALPKALQRSLGEAALKVEGAIQRSIKSQERNIQKLLSDPAAASAVERAAIARKIAQVAAKEAAIAARAATKTMRKDLVEQLRIFAQRKKLHARDLGEVGMDRLDYYSTAEQILNRILSTPAGRMPYDISTKKQDSGGAKKGVQPSARPLHERAFGIEDELIEPFLIKDAKVVMNAYVRSLAPDLALYEKGFMGADFDAKIKLIEDEYNALKRAAPDSAQVAKLTKNMQQDIKDIVALRERLLNVHGLPDDPTSWGARATRGTLAYNYITQLGGMTASAFPDMARSVMVHGLLRTFRTGLLPLMRDFGNFGRLTQELRDLGLATDMITNQRMNSIADTVTEDFSRGHRLERTLGSLNDSFGMITLMAPWNTAHKQFAGVIGMGRLVRAIRDDIAGTIKTKEREWLRSSLISTDDAKKIAQELDTWGEAAGEFTLPRVDKWTDPEVARLFRSSLRRQVDLVIVTPGIGDRPTMATSTLAGRLVFQFKSFALSATSKILLSGLQQADAAAVNGALLSILLGSMTSSFKMWDAGRGEELKDWSLEKWVGEGVDRSGLTGILSDVNNMVERITGVGVSSFGGDGGGAVRYNNRNTLGSLLGPTAGTSQRLVTAASNVAGSTLAGDPWSAKNTERLMRVLPYSNLILFRQVLEGMADTINERVGAE